MPVPFNDYRWFYPPRPTMRTDYKPDAPIIRMWKGLHDAAGQFKQNGTNVQLVVYPDHRTIELWGRKKLGADGKESGTGRPAQIKDIRTGTYRLPTAVADKVLSFTPKGFLTVYNVELLHYKTTTIKNTLYFFDTLVWKSQHLLGVSYRERHGILHGLLNDAIMPLDMKACDGALYLAENLPASAWDDAWRRAKMSGYCEGLVFKRLDDRLEPGDRKKNNGTSLKWRKPNKNFSY